MKGAAKKRRASIFFFEGYLGIQPSVVNFVIELDARGYEIDLFVRKPSMPVPPVTLPNHTRLFECPRTTRRLIDGARRILGRRRTAPAVAAAPVEQAAAQQSDAPRQRHWLGELDWLAEILHFALFCRWHYRKSDLAVAFDANGLAAMTIAVPRRVPFVYWSLELWLMSDCIDRVSRAIKRNEIRSLPRAAAVVIQAPDRAAYLTEGTGLSRDRIVLVPNGPIGPRSTDLPRDFFARRFGLATGKKVVLHAGMLGDDVRSLELAQSVPTWPEPFVLVFHERSPRDPAEPYLRRIAEEGGARVYLSLDPVPFEEIEKVYAGADIGVVSYAALNVNSGTGASASGKVAYYLRQGMPILALTDVCPAVIEQYRCGVWVRSAGEIAAALSEIAADWAGFSARASHCYDDHFDFHKAVDNLMATVAKSATGQRDIGIASDDAPERIPP